MKKTITEQRNEQFGLVALYVTFIF